jgi:hypothetical protein
MSLRSIQQIITSLSGGFKSVLLADPEFYELPSEIWEMVLMYLSPIDLYNFMYCNKTFLKIVLSHVGSLSLHLKNTFRNIEDKIPFAIRPSASSLLKERVKFICIMNIFKFANSNSFEHHYNDNQAIKNSIDPTSTLRNYMQIMIDAGVIQQPNSLYNTSIRYALLKVFYPEDFNIDGNLLYFVKFTNSHLFYKLFVIILNEPAILPALNHSNLKTINYFFINNPTFNVDRYLQIINHVKSLGGLPGRILAHLAYNRLRIYAGSLICGLQEKDANWFASSRTELPEDLLLTFKALYPIVGYYYAKYFILSVPHNLDTLPYFVQVASTLNANNIFDIDKCRLFSKTGGDLDKILTLRNRKRKHT